MPTSLADLVSDLPVVATHGPLDRAVSALVLDSRRAVPGSLFFALPGRRADGWTFAEEAVGRGAVAVLCGAPVTFPNPRVTYIQVADPRSAVAPVARRFYDYPDRSLEVVAVTGTNGKTTTSYLCRHFLAAAGAPVGLLGTVTYDLGARSVPSYKTTPEAIEIFGLLDQMRAHGCRQAAMEISSHGIDQQRVRGIELAAAAFTNLTRDHLDYHGTLEAYFAVKARLFNGENGPRPRVAVLAADDPLVRDLRARLPADQAVLTFGFAADADVRAEDVTYDAAGAAGTVVWPGGRCAFRSPLIGAYNISNLLAATALALAVRADPAAFLPTLPSFAGVPGRMEAIRAGQPFQVVVDYAHTDDALRNALGMLRRVTPGRLLVVFGCGGNRDRTKRPLMAAAVAAQADQAWATADNPRSEALGRIFDDMRAGVPDPARVAFVEDRRLAIGLALDAARPGDTVLIAGKGHETFQEFADTVVPFDDRQVARELLALRPDLRPPA